MGFKINWVSDYIEIDDVLDDTYFTCEDDMEDLEDDDFQEIDMSISQLLSEL